MAVLEAALEEDHVLLGLQLQAPADPPYNLARLSEIDEAGAGSGGKLFAEEPSDSGDRGGDVLTGL